MKKTNKRKPAGKEARKRAAPAEAAAPVASAAKRSVERRETLRRIRDWGLIVALVGAVVWWAVDDVQASRAEQDLTRIGDGSPSIVQVHDPNCSSCLALQSEVRAALSDFEDGELRYLVANLNTTAGRAFANQHGVGHVTLVLFDAQGRKRDVMTGVTAAPTLKTAFRRHVAASARRTAATRPAS